MIPTRDFLRINNLSSSRRQPLLACTAIVSGQRVVASFLSDDDWKQVVKISKQRLVKMPDTGLPAQAKTRRWSGGITRFFSHFPGEAPAGYAGEESPLHAAMKLTSYQRLVAAGFPAELESGRDDWRADVLVGESAFGPELAIEVQLTRQSAQRTYERTHQRTSSGMPTLWIFGTGASTGHLGIDLLARNPVFETSIPDRAADIAHAVCTGTAYFDDLSALAKVPARPIAVKVDCKCGVPWLRPIGVILLPNRIRGDLIPQFVSCCATSARNKGKSLGYEHCDRHLRRYLGVLSKTAERYGLPLGEERVSEKMRAKYGPIYFKDYACPTCRMRACTYGSHGVGLPFKGNDLYRCPLPIMGYVDARPILDLAPAWFESHPSPVEESVMSATAWKTKFIDRLQGMLLLVAPPEGHY